MKRGPSSIQRQTQKLILGPSDYKDQIFVS